MEKQDKRHIELAGTVTLGPKGQVVIPVDVREKMNITPGDKLVVLYIPEKHSVGFVSESSIQEFIDKMGSSIEAFQTALKDK